jgi:hypothetical protein
MQSSRIRARWQVPAASCAKVRLLQKRMYALQRRPKCYPGKLKNPVRNDLCDARACLFGRCPFSNIAHSKIYARLTNRPRKGLYGLERNSYRGYPGMSSAKRLGLELSPACARLNNRMVQPLEQIVCPGHRSLVHAPLVTCPLFSTAPLRATASFAGSQWVIEVSHLLVSGG